MEDASSWYDSSRVVSDAQRRKIGRDNAIKLFNLDLK
jgi:predicted TIM-barrel fold metal-dependent hydrolase